MYLQKRRFGRTDLWVSVVGFGGMWLHHFPFPTSPALTMNEAKRVVRRAFELGINYFDTASNYGDSEEKIGAALEDVRDECIIATKTISRTGKESLTDVEASLRRLKTNRLDIIQLHSIDTIEMLKKAIGPDGPLKTCKKARSKGMVDYIGITGHRPRVMAEAIKTGEFDTVLIPISIVTRQALEEIIPLAKELDIGVAVMKPFAAKTSNVVTWKYTPSLSVISEEPELKALLGEDKKTMIRNALRFVLAQDVSVVVPGLKSVGEVEAAVRVGEEFEGLTEEEKKRFDVQLGADYCRDCGFCLPCSEGLDIPAILRFYNLSTKYGLRKWAKKLYQGLSVRANGCTECGECEPKCPYRLPIVKLLQGVKVDFVE